MKNKILFILLFGVLISLSFFGVAYAQNEDTDFSQEAIVNFHADIFVNAENIFFKTSSEGRGICNSLFPVSGSVFIYLDFSPHMNFSSKSITSLIATLLYYVIIEL